MSKESDLSGADVGVIDGIIEAGITGFSESQLLDTVSAQFIEQGNGGRPGSYMGPAASLVLGTTLEVAEYLSRETAIAHEHEVTLRGQFGISIARELVVPELLESEVLPDVYNDAENIAIPDGFSNVTLAGWLDDEDVLTRIGVAPFSDVSVLVGGVVNYVSRQGFTGEDPRDAAKKSEGLKMFGRINMDHTDIFFTQAGYPYIDRKNLEHYHDETGALALRFTQPTIDLIGELADGAQGCPAAMVDDEGPDGQRVFDTYWDRLTEFLVTDDPTVEKMHSSLGS